MTTARRSLECPASLAEVEALWYDLARWRSWVDGFERVVERREPWPRTGGAVIWQSTPYGRGRVSEGVREYQVGGGQAVAFEDDRMRGTQRVSFAQTAEGVAVTLELRYEIKGSRLAMALVDLLFIRRAVGDSLRRTLEGFARELAER
jgi:polyketide cyclase/dehydrase/lipid transport protein